MLSKVKSFGLKGIEGFEIQIEVDINAGLPGIEIVGLADVAVKEAKERCRSAIKNSGFGFSPKKITVNLAPADIKKIGSFYDLPIAVAFLSASEQLDYKSTENIVFIGELSLDGNIRAVNGILPALISAKEKGYKKFIIPFGNYCEAQHVGGIEVFALKSLRDTVAFLKKELMISAVEIKSLADCANRSSDPNDFKYVKGQSFAKRAMEIAAAGGHNILLIGPPGGGKTMLAKCLPSILPDMTSEEALASTKIHSVAGKLESSGIISSRPFRAPHHTSSRLALTGGGNNLTPGEISLSHNGVLFLDEILEYPRSSLEVLRQPLEDGVVAVSRVAGTVIYPADFMLVASMNPCPCGHFGSKTNECSCSPLQISKYLSKLSGPLLDRIDLHIEVDNITYTDLSKTADEEPSEVVRQRVNAARKRQRERYKDTGINSNSAMGSKELKAYCRLDDKSEFIMKRSFEKLGLSARAYTRILKVARTIADLDLSGDITSVHLTEAIGYRSLDRSYWK